MEQKKQKIGYIIFLFAVYLWSVFLFAACQKQPTWQEQYDLGMRYLSESNYEEAILAFTAAIEIDPNNADTYFKLTESYMAIDKPKEASQVLFQGYRMTVNNTSTSDLTLCDIGLHHFAEQDYDKAILVFTVAIAVEPTQADTYYYLGSVYAAIGDVEACNRVFLEGFQATGDHRMNPNIYSVGGYEWERYNENIPLNKRATYIDFNLFSSKEQALISQFIELLVLGEKEKLQDALILENGFPYQFCTETDKYKVSVVIAKSNPIAIGFGNDGRNNKIGWEEDEASPSTQLILYIEIRPENGQGFRYLYTENFEEGDSYFHSTEYYRTIDCQDWQYNGEWTGSINDSVIHILSYANSNTEERFFQTVYEEAGTAVNNVVTLERYATVSSREYRNGQLINSYETDEPLWGMPESRISVHERW